MLTTLNVILSTLVQSIINSLLVFIWKLFYCLALLNVRKLIDFTIVMIQFKILITVCFHLTLNSLYFVLQPTFFLFPSFFLPLSPNCQRFMIFNLFFRFLAFDVRFLKTSTFPPRNINIIITNMILIGLDPIQIVISFLMHTIIINSILFLFLLIFLLILILILILMCSILFQTILIQSSLTLQ